jgi:hypothetical protein
MKTHFASVVIALALATAVSAAHWPDLHHPEWRSNEPSWDKVIFLRRTARKLVNSSV